MFQRIRYFKFGHGTLAIMNIIMPTTSLYPIFVSSYLKGLIYSFYSRALLPLWNTELRLNRF